MEREFLNAVDYEIHLSNPFLSSFTKRIRAIAVALNLNSELIMCANEVVWEFHRMNLPTEEEKRLIRKYGGTGDYSQDIDGQLDGEDVADKVYRKSLNYKSVTNDIQKTTSVFASMPASRQPPKLNEI